MTRQFTIVDALVLLRPGAHWSMNAYDFDTIIWNESNELPPPTVEELNNELVRLRADYDATKYQRDRAEEYPPITEYLDGVVKGDQAQIDKYIADCQAVKAKYPKAG